VTVGSRAASGAPGVLHAVVGGSCKSLCVSALSSAPAARRLTDVGRRFVAPGSDLPLIDDEADFRCGQQVDKFADRARGMANGEERERHAPLCFNTAALCKAM